ncbi:asparagine synthase C-terminal domain-containing protein [Nocardia sp. NPDC058640]|uniref:asparagine synthase C-terminal domain-containing protein n=1 Tax=Nocardia sp. NPDC058640 TaxID=3346571 RepID=UPI003659C511
MVTLTDCQLDQATAWLDHGLRRACAAIAATKRPVRLLLSGGVDSGLLASYLWETGADVSALTLRTPWGDEVKGATRTAQHVGLPLEVVDLTAEQIVAAIPRCMQLMQSADAESVAVHLLVTAAFELAARDGADLITGLGSDLLNASSELGMSGVSADLIARIGDVSASGLMVTDEFTEGSRLRHPYWEPDVMHLQLAVPSALKTVEGVDKFYVRQLAGDRLPPATASGKKIAIHEGSGLVAGVEATLGETLSSYCARTWNAMAEEVILVGNAGDLTEGASL